MAKGTNLELRCQWRRPIQQCGCGHARQRFWSLYPRRCPDFIIDSTPAAKSSNAKEITTILHWIWMDHSPENVIRLERHSSGHMLDNSRNLKPTTNWAFRKLITEAHSLRISIKAPLIAKGLRWAKRAQKRAHCYHNILSTSWPYMTWAYKFLSAWHQQKQYLHGDL